MAALETSSMEVVAYGLLAQEQLYRVIHRLTHVPNAEATPEEWDQCRAYDRVLEQVFGDYGDSDYYHHVQAAYYASYQASRTVQAIRDTHREETR